MNILELASAFPYPNGVIPASIGGTGEKKNLAKMLARQANFKNTPIWPSVFAYPPTIAASSSTSISTGPLVGWDGTQRMIGIANNTNTGSTVLTFSTTYTPLIRTGMAVRHIMDPANNFIQDGTVVTAVNNSTGEVTISKPTTGYITVNSYIGFGAKVLNFLGAYAQPCFSNSYPYTRNLINAAWKEQPFAVEFDYHGTGFNLIAQDTTAYPRFWLWVDGQPVTASYSLPGSYTPAIGNRMFFNVTFDNASDNTARWRRIRLYMINARFGGIKINANDTISPVRQKYPKIAWLGDSWTEGVAGTGYGTDWLSGTPYQATALLGCGVPFMAGQGSTGYVSVGVYENVTNFGNSARVAPIVAVDPDALVIWGSINDGSYTDTQVQNAAYTLFKTLQSQIPRTKILAVGVQARGAFTTTQDRANNLGIKAAAAAAGVPFLSPVEEGWIEGAGKYGATTGMGNADVMIGPDPDGAHLQQAGCDYYARRIAAWIADQM